jgi:hypothetical protein
MYVYIYMYMYVVSGGGAGVGVLYSEVLGVTLDAYVAYAVCIRMHLTWYAAGELVLESFILSMPRDGCVTYVAEYATYAHVAYAA